MSEVSKSFSYTLVLCFGKVCEQEREKNVRKTQLARVFTLGIV